MATAGFYVYEHRRLDTGAVFYVGKGKEGRAFSLKSRNRHWKNIVAKCGFSSEIVFTSEDEELAFFVEQELIAKHRRHGTSLVNMTNGGEGVCGFHRKQSDEEIERRRRSNIGKKRTAEQCARISSAKQGHGIGSKHSDETRKKMSETRSGRAHPMLRLRGRSRPAHVVAALRHANDQRYSLVRKNLIEEIRADSARSSAELARAAGCNRETAAKYKRAYAQGEF